MESKYKIFFQFLSGKSWDIKVGEKEADEIMLHAKKRIGCKNYIQSVDYENSSGKTESIIINLEYVETVYKEKIKE